jgi:O-antigen ligase
VTPREVEAGGLRLASQGALTELVTSALLFLYPIALLTVREGVNICFTLLVMLAIWSLFTGKAFFRGLNRREIAYAGAMASLVIATALSELSHWHFLLGPYDGASRFLLAIPIYLMLKSCRPETFKGFQYGVPLGAIAAALIVLPQLPLADGARANTPYMDAIRFGDLALALGILSITSVNTTDSRWITALKVAGAAAGLFASIESGSRGGWIALPLVALIWWSLRGRGTLSWGLSTALAGLLIVLAALSYLFVGKVHDRVIDLYSDVVGLFHADLDTSLGERLQIWRVAIWLFAENPLFGIGPDEFQKVLPRIKDLGLLTSVGLQNASAEVHSEILLHSVSLGIFGFASILSIYVVPLILFARVARVTSGYPRSAGVIGACLVTGFLVFGLTIEIFNLKMIATFYSLTVAVLLAACALCFDETAGVPIGARHRHR